MKSIQFVLYIIENILEGPRNVRQIFVEPIGFVSLETSRSHVG